MYNIYCVVLEYVQYCVVLGQFCVKLGLCVP